MPDALVEYLKAVPMRCANCGKTSSFDERDCPESEIHAWETDDAAIARAVRAFFRERVTREKALTVSGVHRAGDGRSVMETHVLLGAEHVLTASNRMKEAAADFATAVSQLQFENQRHEEQMRQIVQDFVTAVGSMR